MSVTVTEKLGPRVRKITFDFVSAADGTATKTYFVSGTIVRVTFDPGAVAPTDNWDVTLTDPHGIDVLAGQGANIDTANTSHVCPGMPITDGTTVGVVPIAVADDLILAIANAGDSKTGKVILYVM